MKIVALSKKVQERRLQWYGHEEYVGKQVMAIEVEGNRERKAKEMV